MKQIFSFILVFSICVSLCACGTRNMKNAGIDLPEPSQTTHISTGLNIDELKAFASSSGVEEYIENESDDDYIDFAFTTYIGKYEGTMLNGEVSAFSLTIQNVRANTTDEFSELAYIGFKDYTQLSYNQLYSALSVMYIMELYVMLGGDSNVTIGDAVAVIMEGTALSANNWSITAELDADNRTLVINVEYA